MCYDSIVFQERQATMIQTSQKWWQPEVYLKNMPHRRLRAQVFKTIRDFFAARSFDEVDTPALQISPGLEVHLKAFETFLHDPLTDTTKRYLLHTSPEFTMKKLLVAGLPRIFQLAKVYRNEVVSPTHYPEFTLLEWYRARETYESIMADTEALVRACATAAQVSLLRHNGREADPFQPWRRLTVAEAFQQYADIDLMATLPENPKCEPDPEKLKVAAEKRGIRCSQTDRWEDVFFRIMLNKIEDNLGDGVPVILYEYPTCLGALARQKPGNPKVVERFEAYACGIELCNAFSELTDPQEQRRRFEADMNMKEKLYGERYPLDEDFMDALNFGMPEAAGNALGVDRLIMLLGNAADIREVQWAELAS